MAYIDLQNAVQRDLYGRTDLTTQIQNKILSAISHYEKEKWWFKEDQDTSLVTVNGQPYLDVPSDFEFDDGFTITYSNYPLPMVKRDWETMLRFLISTTTLKGQPTDYAFFKNQFWFYPTPNAAYTLTLWKTKNLPVLVNSSDANAWTDEAGELIHSRATADIRCQILREGPALEEMALMAQGGMPFYCYREKIAYDQLQSKNVSKLSTGHISPHFF
jgi:hypothetical protein